MIVSHALGLIFVKTRKTAGTSAEIALSRRTGRRDVITRISPTDEELRRREGGAGPQNALVPRSRAFRLATRGLVRRDHRWAASALGIPTSSATTHRRG